MLPKDQSSYPEQVTKNQYPQGLFPNPSLNFSYAKSPSFIPPNYDIIPANPLTDYGMDLTPLKGNGENKNEEQKNEYNVDKKDYEEIQAKTYDDLRTQIKKIADDSGFKLSQNTGLKSGKYAYFYCSYTKKKSKGQRKKLKELKRKKLSLL